jgi:hypothetical protein
MGMKWGISKTLLITLTLCLIFSGQVIAQSNEVPDDEWTHLAKIYLWGSSIDGRSAGGQDVSVDFGTLVDNLEFAFMGGYEARKGRWLLMFDGIYLDVEGSHELDLLPPIEGSPITVTTEATIGLTGTVLQFAGGFNFYKDHRSTTDVIIGVRLNDLSSDLSLRFDLGLPDREQTFETSFSGNLVDGIIGLKSRLELSEKWNLLFYGDIGAGDSDMTWQAMVGGTYRASERTEVALTYRRIDWKIRGDKLHDLSFAGPMLGVIFRF